MEHAKKEVGWTVQLLRLHSNSLSWTSLWQGRETKRYCALTEERADIRIIESRRDEEKRSSQHPVIFSYIAKNSIRHFLQDQEIVKVWKEEREKAAKEEVACCVCVCVYIYIYIRLKRQKSCDKHHDPLYSVKSPTLHRDLIYCMKLVRQPLIWLSS
jgi:hypothetical protein